MKFTKKQFDERFPTSEACLEEIKQRRYSNWTCPKCNARDLLSKVPGRTAYQCVCGNQVYPLVGTIFEKSSTDLRTWFFAMFLMTQTRAGNSAKTLERMTGVTYKTAWRMFTLIRTAMMENSDDLLTGTVEMDETYVGGVQKGKKGRNPKDGNKVPVFGMVERGGRARTAVVGRVTPLELMPHVQANVSRGSRVMSDQLLAYKVLPRLGYPHQSINHGERYVDGEVHTNSVEGFWSILKGGIATVYRHVDRKYLPLYAAEYAWRYSYRNSHTPLFNLLLARIA